MVITSTSLFAIGNMIVGFCKSNEKSGRDYAGSVFRIAAFKILPQKSDYLHYYARIMFRNPISAIVITLSCVFLLQVAFMPYRVNGQYIMEGLASSFLFSMGGLGFIILDKSNAVGMSKLNRFLLLFLGFVCVLVSFFTCRVFMRMKLP